MNVFAHFHAVATEWYDNFPLGFEPPLTSLSGLDCNI